jgi:protein-tyrosine phosphatase
VSHIVDNLYVGGYDFRAKFGDFFSHVFSLYKWESYGENEQTGPDTIHTAWTMYDSRSGVQVEDLAENPLTIEEVADEVVAALEAGGNVLVHCQAGINRSNLTAAIVLMKWKGLTAAQAIDMLREKRGPLVLANRTFENYLRRLDEVSTD